MATAQLQVDPDGEPTEISQIADLAVLPMVYREGHLSVRQLFESRNISATAKTIRGQFPAADACGPFLQSVSRKHQTKTARTAILEVQVRSPLQKWSTPYVASR